MFMEFSLPRPGSKSRLLYLQGLLHIDLILNLAFAVLLNDLNSKYLLILNEAFLLPFHLKIITVIWLEENLSNHSIVNKTCYYIFHFKIV